MYKNFILYHDTEINNLQSIIDSNGTLSTTDLLNKLIDDAVIANNKMYENGTRDDDYVFQIGITGRSIYSVSSLTHKRYNISTNKLFGILRTDIKNLINDNQCPKGHYVSKLNSKYKISTGTSQYTVNTPVSHRYTGKTARIFYNSSILLKCDYVCRSTWKDHTPCDTDKTSGIHELDECGEIVFNKGIGINDFEYIYIPDEYFTCNDKEFKQYMGKLKKSITDKNIKLITDKNYQVVDMITNISKKS